jgi:hypothetical protein
MFHVQIVKRGVEMPTISNKKEIIDHMEKSYDRQFKASYLLMAAHGTGLVTAISILKDYVKEPQLNGVGLFLIICGVGFITSLIGIVVSIGLLIYAIGFLAWRFHIL